MTENEKHTNILMGLKLLHMKWLDRAMKKEEQGLVGLANTYRKWADEVGTQIKDLDMQWILACNGVTDTQDLETENTGV